MGDFSNGLIVFGAKYLIVFIAGLAFWSFINQPRDKQKEMVIFGIIILPIIYAVSRIGAAFYYDPRPFVTGHFLPLIPHDPDNGFPSDHTLLSSAIAMVVFYYNRRGGWGLLFLAFLVGLARVLAGVHHVIDVAGSVAIATVVSFLVYKFLLPGIINSGYCKKWRT